MRTTFLVGAMAAATCANAVNLVTNGDFESGNTGFTSGYAYVAPGPDALTPPNVYTVDTSAGNSHGSFANFGDHTTGQGLYMIVNGSTTSGTNVWKQSINVVSGQLYSVSLWVANANPESPATLSVSAGNSVVLTGEPTGLGVWSSLSGSFIATTTGSIDLTIDNSNSAFSGNDFAIDDISVEAVPEPGTLVVLGLGLLAARRRARK